MGSPYLWKLALGSCLLGNAKEDLHFLATRTVEGGSPPRLEVLKRMPFVGASVHGMVQNFF